MKKRDGKRTSSIQKTKKLTASALICALGTVMLCAGQLFGGSLDLTMAALASLLCVWALEELGGIYPWLIWLTTSVLSVILIPFNSAAWEYLLFAGLYPMLRVLLDKLPLIVRILLKQLIFIGTLGLLVLILWRALFPAAQSYPAAFGFFLGGEGASRGYSLVVFLMANVAFFLYDLVIGRFIRAYRLVLREKFKFFQIK